MNNLSFDDVQISQDVDFFSTVDTEENAGGNETTEEKETNDTTEIDENDLFSSSESVGGNNEEENTEGDKGSSSNSTEDGGSSPNNTVFSSIAAALKEDGVLPDIADEDIKDVTDAEKLIDAMRKQMESTMTAREKRINDALDNNVEIPVIKQYENVLSQLDNITEESLTDESDDGVNLRKNIIYQDYINKGFSKERAIKKTEQSFDAATDIEDAKEALESNKEFFKGKYQEIIDEAKEATKKAEKANKDFNDSLQKTIMETDEPFDGVKLDKVTKKKVLDTLNKAVYKDENGNVYNKIQKYQMDNRADYIYKLGVIFTLTDGFKDLSGLVKNKIEKEKKKSIRELEHVVNSTSTFSDGSVKFVSGVGNDKNSYSGLTLNI
jgi:hypothetical protein